MTDDLLLAQELADDADRIAMAGFRAHDLRVDTKADLSPVTAVDRAIEERIRERVERDRPSHVVLGEEFGGERGAAGWQWVIDPIDGTRSFVRGNETWAILIALRRDGETQLAVASAPAMRLRYHAIRGQGAHLNGRRISVSRIARVEEAMIAHTSVRGFVRTGQIDRFTELVARCWDARGVGNSLTHLMVARGTADIGWTSRANVWDFAALSLIVEEAGGSFTDRSGDDPVLGGTGIPSNGLLHDSVLQAAG
ncbi:MAG: histidinol-phosphatase, partial [Candidatus Dormibacteraeota bacterium]|nr:histidinol-phosphatase [Candidatus Dormibacteraeota bacterium]